MFEPVWERVQRLTRKLIREMLMLVLYLLNVWCRLCFRVQKIVDKHLIYCLFPVKFVFRMSAFIGYQRLLLFGANICEVTESTQSGKDKIKQKRKEKFAHFEYYRSLKHAWLPAAYAGKTWFNCHENSSWISMWSV